MNETELSRFQSKVQVDIETGCHIWTAGRLHSGYGVFSLRGRRLVAHRVAYEHWIGPIPEGMVLHHECRIRPCVNPSHLRPVSTRENLLLGEGVSAVAAKKTHCPQGHPYDEKNTYVNPAGKRQCRTCLAARRRQWGKKSGNDLATLKAWVAANPEKAREAIRRWEKDHWDLVKARKREAYAQNREAERARKRERYAANLEKSRAQVRARYHARKAKAAALSG